MAMTMRYQIGTFLFSIEIKLAHLMNLKIVTQFSYYLESNLVINILQVSLIYCREILIINVRAFDFVHLTLLLVDRIPVNLCYPEIE